jgi:hypothetical protein
MQIYTNREYYIPPVVDTLAEIEQSEEDEGE